MQSIRTIINDTKIQKVDNKQKFVSFFDFKTGFYVRTGIIDENGNDTNIDPFMASYPELIDIGIMGRCIHGEKGLCLKAGIQCYQNGKNIKKENMKLEDFKSIIDQSKGKVFQIALGGRGDPNKHEHFEEILKYTTENYIVPNYTTSGLNLTDEEINLTKTYCGAAAVSWYRSDYTLNSIDKFIQVDMKTNIHYVLGKNTIDEAIELIKNDNFPKGINAVIFLLHKPVGLGTQENVLDCKDPRLKEFFSLIDTVQNHHKIGFDSCTVPAILNYCNNINYNSMDSCEGGRYSAYISSDMIMTPCSFDQDEKWGVNLKENTIQETWNSDMFENFRLHFHNSCLQCNLRNECKGGCPIKREIVLCNKTEKELR